MIRKITITDRLQEKILEDESVKSWSEKLGTVIDDFGDVSEVFVDYDDTSKEIRADMLFENDVIVILRRIIDGDKNDIVSYSISVGKTVMEVNWCNIYEIKNRIYENKEKYDW